MCGIAAACTLNSSCAIGTGRTERSLPCVVKAERSAVVLDGQVGPTVLPAGCFVILRVLEQARPSFPAELGLNVLWNSLVSWRHF